MKARVLVVGAAGLLGRYVVRTFAREHEVWAMRRADLDVRDREQVERVLRAVRPQVVINCAAISDVDACERDPELAFQVNAEGPRHLAEVCCEIEAALVQISTDYIFDGHKREPYTIADPPRPLNRYGASKWAGEEAVRRTWARHYIVRVARLFGFGGRNFASSLPERLRAREPLRAIVDEVGSPTYAADLATRLLEILARGHPGTYHVTNSGVCSWYEFACEVARQLGCEDVRIEPIRSTDLNRPAQRPLYTALRCLLSEQLGLPALRSWSLALRDFLEEVRSHGSLR
ncbi:MAG: dTDP-4-dehydrorhamnose reductase [Blastocatellia bacterium]|nr:dTDP-4-dehydrorhamnose reductase [Blastocatellia bacterium]MCS7156553.1 dTDP-4-dehydrorhamnose reductase [Blastocatellia bacterium]MCX7751706.1 dTDP-4-dehydrorhamnose reductase [Blastocatellia bacterium]MDW8168807.1 dTDP-4-dehydrorhamnose reductase [Acidobacteriota bacterium]MDW8257479.1 dTDP-4-dehydrorhamnose reductase [Acidobacteriota bacterium]